MPTAGDSPMQARPLLVALVRDGQIVADLDLSSARTRYEQSLAELPARALQLSRGEPVITTVFEGDHPSSAGQRRLRRGSAPRPAPPSQPRS
jgi:hypothetical protein